MTTFAGCGLPSTTAVRIRVGREKRLCFLYCLGQSELAAGNDFSSFIAARKGLVRFLAIFGRGLSLVPFKRSRSFATACAPSFESRLVGAR